MSTTLQHALEALESLRRLPPARRPRRVASALAGKLRGFLPNGLTSTAYVRQLRDSLYGKLNAP